MSKLFRVSFVAIILFYGVNSLGMLLTRDDIDPYKGSSRCLCRKLIIDQARLSCLIDGKNFAIPFRYKSAIIRFLQKHDPKVEKVFPGDEWCENIWPAEWRRDYRGGAHQLKADLSQGELILANKWQLSDDYKKILIDHIDGK